MGKHWDRWNPRERRESILTHAMEVVRQRGEINVTRQDVAEKAQVSESLVSKYFATVHQLRKAVARKAKLLKDVEVLAAVMLSPRYRFRIENEALREEVLKTINERL